MIDHVKVHLCEFWGAEVDLCGLGCFQRKWVLGQEILGTSEEVLAVPRESLRTLGARSGAAGARGADRAGLARDSVGQAEAVVFRGSSDQK